MTTKHLVQLVTVGDLAMALWRAEEAAANAKAAYHREIQRYEEMHGQLAKLIRKDDPDHAAVRAFTAAKYAAQRQANRRVYSLKLRLGKACTAMARMTAERAA